MDDKRFIELLAKKKSGQLTLPEQMELYELENENSYYSLLESFVDEVFKAPVNFESSLSSKVQKSSFETIREKINQPNAVVLKSKGKVFRILQIAASIILIAALSTIWYLNSGKKASSERPNIVSTKKGSKSNIELPDGTQVWLNADSKITYEKSFGTSTREVELTGEAYFDVTHDASRPFIVHTGNADIKVLGTTFNVRNYSEDKYIEAALIKGKVEVLFKNNKESRIVLNPSEKITIKKDAVAKNMGKPEASKSTSNDIFTLARITQTDSVIAETSWVQNRLVVIDKPLHEIADELARQYDLKVIFRTPASRNFHYTINVENSSPAEIMDILSLSKRINYKLVNNELLIE